LIDLLTFKPDPLRPLGIEGVVDEALRDKKGSYPLSLQSAFLKTGFSLSSDLDANEKYFPSPG